MAAPVNTISYGIFNFPFAKLTVTSSTEYAADGATVIGTAYQFNISGVLTATDSTAMKQKILDMRSFCNTPRLELKIVWDSGQDFYDFTNTDDIKWGPKPGDLNITSFFGGRAAFYTWSVAVIIKECSVLSSTCSLFNRPQEILAITRRFDHQISPDGLTTRNISGQLWLTSTAQRAGYTPDHLRWYVTPILPKGYRRIAQDFQTSEDGLVLAYTITDQEVTYTLPQPMTDGAATWRVSCEELGAIINYELSGWFSAPPQIAKNAILQAIIDLINSRFPSSSSGVTVFFDSNSFDEDIYNNRISFSVRAHAVGQAQDDGTVTSFSFADSYSTIGKPPPNATPGFSYIPSPYGGDWTNGTSGTIAFPFPLGADGSLYDACLNNLSVYGKPITVGTTYPSTGGSGGGGSGGTAGDVTTTPGDLTSDAKSAPYIEHLELILYSINNNIRTFLPKSLNSSTPPYNPQFQQTAPPLLTVIQAGYTIRDIPASSSTLPKPMPPVIHDNVIMLKADITPATPIPVGLANATRWRVDWCYIMRMKKGFVQPTDISSGDLALVFPLDPRTQTPGTDTGTPLDALDTRDIVNPTVTPPV